jgi:hypothetical protein
MWHFWNAPGAVCVKCGQPIAYGQPGSAKADPSGRAVIRWHTRSQDCLAKLDRGV